ncbi:MAG TPA: hypothetical protein VFA61_04885 [Candidatus Udaeobacter sp.]|nr:hypothetical protein [Candidatus Udaeobacter sp.]
MRSMIAAHLDNLLFLLLVAVALLFQFLAKTAGKAARDRTKRTSTPRTPPPIPRTSRESDEDRVRKLLEALGQPPTSKPPPTVTPRTNIPPRPLAPVRPPTVYPSPARQWTQQARRKRDIAQKESHPPAVTRAKELVPPGISVASTFEVHEGQFPVKLASTAKADAKADLAAPRTIAKIEERKSDIIRLLASTSGLRNAMILRELLGPPRSLRMLELL